MAVLEFEIEDQLVENMGLQHIKDFLNRQIAFLKAAKLGEKISQVIQHSGFDHDKEVQAAREEAWQEYKTRCLHKLS